MKESIQTSNYNLSNKFARIYLDAIEQVMGKSDLHQLLEVADLEQFINNRPPDNLNKQFDFAYFTALQVGFRRLAGEDGGKELAYRAGRESFPEGLKQFGDLAGVTAPTFFQMPLQDRLRVGLPALANVMSQFSDQVSRTYPFDDRTYIFTLERCPMCWRHEAEDEQCQTGLGLLKAGLNWASEGKEFRVEIESCIASGAEMGRYVIYKDPIEA